MMKGKSIYFSMNTMIGLPKLKKCYICYTQTNWHGNQRWHIVAKMSARFD